MRFLRFDVDEATTARQPIVFLPEEAAERSRTVV